MMNEINLCMLTVISVVVSITLISFLRNEIGPFHIEMGGFKDF